MQGSDQACAAAVDASLKRRRVRLLGSIVLIGTVTSIAFHYAMGFWLAKGYPYSTFLFQPVDHFGDWNNTYLYAQAFLHGGMGSLVYFPFAFLVVAGATVFPVEVGFALLVGVFIVVLVAMVRRWVVDGEEHPVLRLQYGFILVALSYPVLFVLDRANLEMLLFVFIAGFFYFLYVRRSPWLAAFCLAAAIAFKLYPATFLLLLLAEHRVRLFVVTIGIAVGFTALGAGLLAVAGGHGVGEVLRLSVAEKSVNMNNGVAASQGLQHGHTLWGLLRLPSEALHGEPPEWQTALYAVAAALIFVLIAIHVVLREKELWKRVLLVTAAALLLPFVSADYTLILLYFPLLFFVNVRRAGRWDGVYTALFGVLLIPVDYYYFAHLYDVSISVIVYPLALLALVGLAVCDRAPAGDSPGSGSAKPVEELPWT
jgi:hypothetical protein